MNSREKWTVSLNVELILTVSAAVTASMIGWLLYYSHYGFDFTDESYYLVWLANPFNYSVSNTQFGFIYHPLYSLLEGNIAALRQINILITFGLAWILGNVFFKTVFELQAPSTKYRLIVSAAFGTTALILFDYGVLTPSYNSLNLQAFLLTAIGLLLADGKGSRENSIGWPLIGIGGWLAFMAKPTSAAALALCSIVYLLLTGKWRIHFLIISIGMALGLLIISALIIDGSISGFIDRLTGGIDELKILDGGHKMSQLFRLDNVNLNLKTKIILFLSTITIAGISYWSQSTRRLLNNFNTILSMSFGLIGLLVICGFIQKPLSKGYAQGLLIFAVPFASFLVAGLIIKFKKFFYSISLSQKALGVILLVIPHAYSFGTNNNYWLHDTGAAIFWVLAGLIAFIPITSNRQLYALLLSLSLAAQLITLVLIQGGIEAPYRQPQPLYKNDYMLEIGSPGSALLLSSSFGNYLAEVINVAKQAGFKKGMPIIDLTGQSPGVLYALGANNIGQVWTIGGYPGSDALAVDMLKKSKCTELAVAWLLAEPDGLRKISSKILLSFGADFAKDFELVGTFKTPLGESGYKYVRDQTFLKPLRDMKTAIFECEKVRRTGNDN